MRRRGTMCAALPVCDCKSTYLLEQQRTRPAPLTRPMPISSAAADALSAFLKPCRVECQRTFLWRLSSPWGLEFTRTGPGFVIILEGSCRMRVPGMAEDMVLRRNDFAVTTRAGGFAICDRPDSRLANGDHLLGGDVAPS